MRILRFLILSSLMQFVKNWCTEKSPIRLDNFTAKCWPPPTPLPSLSLLLWPLSSCLVLSLLFSAHLIFPSIEICSIFRNIYKHMKLHCVKGRIITVHIFQQLFLSQQSNMTSSIPLISMRCVPPILSICGLIYSWNVCSKNSASSITNKVVPMVSSGS